MTKKRFTWEYSHYDSTGEIYDWSRSYNACLITDYLQKWELKEWCDELNKIVDENNQLRKENEQLKSDNNRLVNETAKIVAEYQGRVLDLIDDMFKKAEQGFEEIYDSYYNGQMDILKELKKELQE